MTGSWNFHAEAVGAIDAANTHIAQQLIVFMLEPNDELPVREEDHQWLNSNLID